MQPLFQQKIAYGESGYPFTADPHSRYDYSSGICPVTELMHESALVLIELMHSMMAREDLGDVIMAFQKVYTYLPDLTLN